MWRAYLDSIGESPRYTSKTLSSWHFCDNEADADELAELTRLGIKRATTSSLMYFQAGGHPIPQPGDVHVITNWAGDAVCVIETVRVQIVPFNEIDAEYAAEEGEGDKSLEYWRRVHWDYYHRELAGTGYAPAEDMPVVCEHFRVVFAG